jgi:hypothetical protein
MGSGVISREKRRVVMAGKVGGTAPGTTVNVSIDRGAAEALLVALTQALGGDSGKSDKSDTGVKAPEPPKAPKPLK